SLPYDLRVTVPAGGYLKSVKLGERELSDLQIDGARPGGALTIALAADGGRLSGSVVDARGQPVDGAAVVAVPAGPRSKWAELARSAISDKDGKFEMRDVAPGSYRVLAWEDVDEGAPLDADFRRPFERNAAEAAVTAGVVVVVQLKVIPVA